MRAIAPLRDIFKVIDLTEDLIVIESIEMGYILKCDCRYLQSLPYRIYEKVRAMADDIGSRVSV